MTTGVKINHGRNLSEGNRIRSQDRQKTTVRLTYQERISEIFFTFLIFPSLLPL